MSDLGILLQPFGPSASTPAGRRRANWLVRILPGLGACGLAGLLIAGLMEPRVAEPPVAPLDPVWIDAGAPLYGLAPAGFSHAPRGEALKRSHGPGRQDVLTFGQSAGAGDWLRLSVQQAGPLDPAPGSLFLDLTRTAARAGVAVTRAALPGLLTTRFGGFEVADVELAQGEGSRACLGFRFLAGEPDLRILGLACGRDRAALACALDGLHMVAPEEDAGIARFFSEAPRKEAVQARKMC